MTAKLILVRHSLPQIDPDVPSYQWRLSAAGRAQCQPLARSLEKEGIQVIFTSPEPKAQETAEILAAHLGNAPVVVHAGLREHDRRHVGFIKTGFEDLMRRFFAHPDEKVFGQETAEQALARFEKALAECQTAAEQPQLIVSHGTVISLYVSHALPNIDAFTFWKQLKMPAAFVLPPRARPEVNC